jgi:hypothetical protein
MARVIKKFTGVVGGEEVQFNPGDVVDKEIVDELNLSQKPALIEVINNGTKTKPKNPPPRT